MLSQDITMLLNKEQVFFTHLPDKPVMQMGEKASRQMMIYRIMMWPPWTPHADSCMKILKTLISGNRSAWTVKEAWLTDLVNSDSEDSESWKMVLSEFIAVKNIMRRLLVQLILLAFCDGLGECHLSGEQNVPGDLASNFYRLAMRLPSERYGAIPNTNELRNQLILADCKNATIIADTWVRSVNSWTKEVF
eukprot:IDg1697t1